MLGNALEIAYRLTIFGYSAPKTDVNAIEMMKKAWGGIEKRNLEETELIDIRSENDVKASWNDFIHTHHYGFFRSFFDSALAKYPRRTCEALFDQTMNNQRLNPRNGFKENTSFDEISNKLSNLIIEEEETESQYNFLSNPYL